MNEQYEAWLKNPVTLSKEEMDAMLNQRPILVHSQPLVKLPTREEWLNNALHAFRPWFDGTGVTLPEKIRVSCGWPSERGLSAKKRVIGECWDAACSADGFVEIFISPYNGEPYDAIETLLHEMIHGAGCKGHKGSFARVAKKLGFEAPWKSTPAGDELRDKLNTLLGTFDPYPHGKLNMEAIAAGLGGKKPQTTRMIKCSCDECGYVARTTKKWISIGMPWCPTHKKPMEPDEPLDAMDDIQLPEAA